MKPADDVVKQADLQADLAHLCRSRRAKERGRARSVRTMRRPKMTHEQDVHAEPTMTLAKGYGWLAAIVGAVVVYYLIVGFAGSLIQGA
jgi:predicted phage tail protein